MFTKDFLETVRSITNELLNLAYQGDLLLDEFKITDSEFVIPLIKNGFYTISDISVCSQGEKSLTTISLYNAIIERAIKGFNILYLDEVDGPLNKTNRERFMTVLETQVNKLNIPQVFVISHNDVYDSIPVTLCYLRMLKK